jgi:NHL repeat-containing protein
MLNSKNKFMKKKFGNIPKAVNKSRLCLLALCYCLGFSALGGCDDDETSVRQHDPNLPVTVNQVFPDSGKMTDPVIIHGNNFGTDKSRIKVLFDDKEAVILTAENEHLYILNPKQKSGKHTVKVVVDGKEGVALQQFKYLVSTSVYTVAGTGEYNDADGSALEATFARPTHLAIDDQGNLIVIDYNSMVRLVSISEARVRTLKVYDDIYGCCFSPDYNILYTGQEGSSRISYIFQRNSNWEASALMNDGTLKYTCDVATIDNGDLIAINVYGQVARIDKNTNEIKLLGEMDSGAMGSNVDFHMNYNLRDKKMYVSSYSTHVIIRFDPYRESLTVADFELFAGKVNRAGYMDGNVQDASFREPCQMGFDEDGNMLLADRGNHVIRMITPEGIVSTFAGSEMGDADGKPEEAKFNKPQGLAVAPDGLVYVAERDGRKIRCIAIQ